MACDHAGCTVVMTRSSINTHQTICEHRQVVCKGGKSADFSGASLLDCTYTGQAHTVAMHEATCRWVQIRTQFEADQLQIKILQAQVECLRKPYAQDKYHSSSDVGHKRKTVGVGAGATAAAGGDGPVQQQQHHHQTKRQRTIYNSSVTHGFHTVWLHKPDNGIKQCVVRNEKTGEAAININWIWKGTLTSILAPAQLIQPGRLPPGMLYVSLDTPGGRPLMYGTVELMDHVLEAIRNGGSPFVKCKFSCADAGDILLAKKLLADHGQESKPGSESAAAAAAASVATGNDGK
jgi:hypothetical protein